MRRRQAQELGRVRRHGRTWGRVLRLHRAWLPGSVLDPRRGRDAADDRGGMVPGLASRGPCRDADGPRLDPDPAVAALTTRLAIIPLTHPKARRPVSTM